MQTPAGPAQTLNFGISVPSDRDQIPVLIERVVKKLAAHDLSNEEFDPVVRMMLEESVVNAVIHGNLEVQSEIRDQDVQAFDRLIATRATQAPFRSRRVHINVSASPQHFELTVEDEGRGFDVARLRREGLRTRPHAAHGRGLELLKAFADSVEFNAQGNRLKVSVSR